MRATWASMDLRDSGGVTYLVNSRPDVSESRVASSAAVEAAILVLTMLMIDWWLSAFSCLILAFLARAFENTSTRPSGLIS